MIGDRFHNRLEVCDPVEVTAGVLRGAKGIVIAISQRTGGLTVQLVENFRAYHEGSSVHLMPYEVQRRHLEK